MTSQELEEALFAEEMAEDAFLRAPSPVNYEIWQQARALVDSAVEQAA
jgi:hypothetical protein